MTQVSSADLGQTTPRTENSPRSLPVAQAIEIVKNHPGKTSRELASESGKDRFTMARRLPEAANSDEPAIEKGEARTCRVTGKQSITWWPVLQAS